MIHNTVLLEKHTQETNQKQKFQKHQNENISLTNLNVANNGNFPILAFGDNIKWMCEHVKQFSQKGNMFNEKSKLGLQNE